ncbi:M48 family metalloprotease [Corallococcus exercitus]|uniref:M48 family metalloprotease n=1 Tax=Corallococcus exercitus TaxID=2316736 RepID=A0A7Y4KFM4_9BACT|nr:M48 family metallopeptidase [Corallococcus exercitus]NOK32968.1 M48 family metalloprotease [Corallococcus exercitus]
MRSRMGVLAVTGLGLCLTSCAQVTKELKKANLGGDVNRVVAASEKVQSCDKLKVEPAIQEEYALGSALAIHWAQQGGGLMLAGAAEERLSTYVNTVGRNLAMQSPRPELNWTFGVLKDTKRFNALSAPAGYVFVTQGLLQGVDNEAQLAGVLAHEIAHVVLKHALNQYVSVKVSKCKLATGATAIASIGASMLLDASQLDGRLDLDANTGLMGEMVEGTVEAFGKGNRRDEELAADALAVELLLSAGYDPGAYSLLLGKTTGDGGLWANHPSKKDRQAQIDRLVQERREATDPLARVDVASLQRPALPAAFAIVGPGKKSTGVAKDAK